MAEIDEYVTFPQGIRLGMEMRDRKERRQLERDEMERRREQEKAQAVYNAARAQELEQYRMEQLRIRDEENIIRKANEERLAAKDKMAAQEGANKKIAQEEFMMNFQSALQDITTPRPPMSDLTPRKPTAKDVSAALATALPSMREPGSLLEGVRALSALEEQNRLGMPKATPQTPSQMTAIPVVDAEGNVMGYQVPTNTKMNKPESGLGKYLKSSGDKTNSIEGLIIRGVRNK